MKISVDLADGARYLDVAVARHAAYCTKKHRYDPARYTPGVLQDRRIESSCGVIQKTENVLSCEEAESASIASHEGQLFTGLVCTIRPRTNAGGLLYSLSTASPAAGESMSRPATESSKELL
jgi:hypothetical protein